jgi:DNA-binding MarR family transcriptional regulator
VPLPRPLPEPARLAPAGAADPAGPAGTADDRLEIVLGILRLARALDSVDSGLSPQQYRILKLAGAGGERSARLAERLAVAKPTLTAIADSLVAAGLARREAEPGDRRVVRLHLTEAGLAAVERADAAYGQWLDKILELSGNGEQLQADLRLMVGALEELRRRKKAAAASTRTGDTTTATASTTSPTPSAETASPAPTVPPAPAHLSRPASPASAGRP